jgi:murein DD-endopeptidase MepM/ murein hydrolase activator NlpD
MRRLLRPRPPLPCLPLLLLPLLATPRALPGQGARVAWHGDPPAQGTVAWLVVIGEPEPVHVTGTLSDVPLAFARVDRSRFAALVGVPIDAPDTVVAALRLQYPRGEWRAHAAPLAVRRVRYPTERLRVDPAFTRRPDSALAERIRREAAAARAVADTALATPRLWTGSFAPPRESRITSRYGTGRVFNGQLRSRHLGVDFDGAVGEPVHATNRGVVSLVGDFYYAGRVVYVNHGAGLNTAYLHLSEALVAPGDTVTGGQLIGKVGQSGRVTGPHLHWAVRYGAAAVDGTSLLALPPLERLTESR